ncbi:hypothetical protein MTBUT4_210016 [Magnetospirillum sp. UT-4]|nr:hypothetical protein MTBUT4_210016 [Magnetospirillum sp. UT-4]
MILPLVRLHHHSSMQCSCLPQRGTGPRPGGPVAQQGGMADQCLGSLCRRRKERTWKGRGLLPRGRTT